MPKFPLILTLAQDLAKTVNLQALLHEIVRTQELDRIHIADQAKLNESPCVIVYFYGCSTAAKVEALHRLLTALAAANPETDSFTVGVLIPPAVLATVDSKQFPAAHVTEESKEVNERQIVVEGRPASIVQTVRRIYHHVVEQSPEPRTPVAQDTDHLKFLVPDECVGYIIGKNGLFTKQLRKEFNVELRVERFDVLPAEDRDYVAVSST